MINVIDGIVLFFILFHIIWALKCVFKKKNRCYGCEKRCKQYLLIKNL